MMIKPALQKIFKGILYTDFSERIYFMKQIDDRIRKESIMSNSIKNKTPKMNNGKRNEQIVIESTRTKTAEIIHTHIHIYV
jgi:hypothetical protein